MTKFIFLLNHELLKLIKRMSIPYILLITAQLAALSVTASREQNAYLRFEELAQMSGFEPVFHILLFICAGIIGYCFYKDWLGGKSIYSLMCLPVPRYYIYFAKLLSAFVSLCVFAGVQVVNIFLSHGLYGFFLLPEVPKLQNGLLLAFLRWDFFRLFYPSGLSEVLISLLYLLALATVIVFSVAAQRAARYYSLGFSLAAALFLLILPFGELTRSFLIFAYSILLWRSTVVMFNSGSIA